MYSEIIQMPRKRCIYEVDQLFAKDEKISIIRKTDSLVEFKKGNLWSLETSPKNVFLEGTMTFEGNGKTTININYDRTKFIYTYIILIPLLALLGIFFIFTPVIFPFMKDTPWAMFLQVFGIIYSILICIAPLIDFHIRKSGERLFADEMFLHLTNLSYEEKE